MNDVLAQLRPQPALRQNEGDEYDGGYGNLSVNGAIQGMSVPRVLDVRLLQLRHIENGS